MALTFNIGADTEILELVQEFPCVYDKYHEHFKNIRAKERAWECIGRKMSSLKNVECSGKSIRARFSVLRTRYTCERRKIRSSGASTTGTECTWPLYTKFAFLDKFISQRQSKRNGSDDMFIYEDEEPQDTKTSPFSDLASSPIVWRSYSPTPPTVYLGTQQTEQKSIGPSFSGCLQSPTGNPKITKSSEEYFAQSIAIDLAKIKDPLIRAQAKIEISKVIYKAMEEDINS